MYKVFVGICLLFTTACMSQEVEPAPSENAPVEQESYRPFMQSGISPKTGHATFGGRITAFVWQMYEDQSGNFWFASNHDGLFKYNGQEVQQFTPMEGIGGKAVRAVLEDAQGILWFGTASGLTKYDGRSFVNYTVKDGLVHNEIWSLCFDEKGNIWIGTNGGVSIFDGTSFQTVEVPKPAIEDFSTMIDDRRVSAITMDRHGKMWMVNDGRGITTYDHGQFSFYTTSNGLPDNNVAEVYEDRHGKLWIGTFYGGVSRFDGQNFEHFTKEGRVKGVESYNFCEDQQMNLWFSTENQGVYRFDGNSFKQYTMEDGLATNTIQSIYADREGYIWFSTWEGLSLYDGKQIVDAGEKFGWVRE